MPLSDLYLMNEKQILNLYKELAETYYHDDLYSAMLPDNTTRLATLRHFFKSYVKAIRPYCHFVADSDQLQGVMIIWDSRLKQVLRCRIRLIWTLVQMIPMLIKVYSWNGMLHVLHCLDMFTSRWIYQFVTGAYFHLDIFYLADCECKVQIGHRMLQELVAEAQIQHREITLHTHQAEHVSLYTKAGFVLMSEISHVCHDIHQYNLLMKND